MSEVIPISKSPTQEKAPFVPPKLDWNENGEFSVNFRDFQSSNIQHFISPFSLEIFRQDGVHASFPIHSRTCLINHSAKAIVLARSATGQDPRRLTRSTTTNISLSSVPVANMPTIMKRMRPLSTWSTLLECRSRLIKEAASVVDRETIGEIIQDPTTSQMEFLTRL